MTVYYVSTNGNDANIGSFSNPFLSIQKACDIAISGDVIKVLPGTYTMGFQLRKSNVKVDGLEMPVIDMAQFDTLTGISVVDCENSVISGFSVKNAYCGVKVGTTSAEGFGATKNILISNCESFNARFWGMAAASSKEHPTTAPIFKKVKIFNTMPLTLPNSNGHGLKLAANFNDAGGSGAIIEDSEIAWNYNHGIQSSNGWTNTTVKRCKLYENSQKGQGNAAGLRFGTTITGKAEDCEFWGMKQCGVLLQDRASKITVNRCKFTKNAFGIVSYDCEFYMQSPTFVGNLRDIQVWGRPTT